MRIYRSLSFRIGTVSRRALVLAGSSVLVVASLSLGVLSLQRPQTTYAATPPDTCFAFTVGTGTITNYYDYQNNNAANPACPKAVDIPTTIGGVSVTTIGAGAFASKQLTAVSMPNTITSIGDGGFYGNQLSTITIPNVVTSIGSSAFQNNQLTSLTIPSSVVTISYSAFYGNQLTSLTIPSSVTTISGGAFSNNPLTSVSIPSSVTSLGYAFENDPLTSVKIGAPTIPSGMFYSKGLRSLVLEEGVVNIGDAAFQNNQLTSVTIPNSVTTIGNGAFSSNRLTSITIPHSVTSLGYAFGGNPLSSATIAAPTILPGLFSGMGLTSLVLEEGVTTIGSGAFGSNQLTSVTIPNSIITIGDGAFVTNQLTSLTIPESVTSIGTEAFVNNSLISVTIEGNPTVGSSAFASNGLDQSTIPSGLTTAQEIDYYRDMAEFVRLYATDPGFLAANQDTVYSQCVGAWNGTNYDPPCYITSGYLINPAAVTVRSVDTTGNELQPATVYVSDTYVDYRLSSNPDLPTLASPSYYRVGNKKSFTAPSINGYVLTSAATQSSTLTAEDNTVTFTYAAPVHTVPFATNTVVNYISTATSPSSSLSSSLITNSSLSIPSASGSCGAISSADLLPVTDTLTSAAPANVTLLGGVNFTLHCASAGTTAVTYTLGAEAEASTLRVYKFAHGVLSDITDHVAIATVGGVTTISYDLTDGGEYDEDGIANGTITDPLYVGTVSSSHAVTVTQSAKTQELAETGAVFWLPLLVGSGLLLAGARMVRQR